MAKNKTHKRGFSKFLYVSCVSMIFIQAITIFGLIIYFQNNAHGLGLLDMFFTVLAMSALLSIALLFVGWIVYGSYKANALFIALFAFLVLVCVLIASFFVCGIEGIMGALTGLWMEFIHKLIFCLLGLIVFSFSIWYIINFESEMDD